jgi:hypothetical protein
MSVFQTSAKMICLSAILLCLSCASFGQKKQIKKETVQKSESETVKTTEAEVVGDANSELSTKDIAQNRDLSAYRQGGFFDCREWFSKNEARGDCDENKLRDFIWQSWTSKTRGYVRVTYNSVDAVSTSHIFIEPDEKGQWRVAWRIVRRHVIPELNNRIDDILGITAVEQISDKPKKGDRALIFKNKSGAIIQKMPYFYE